MFVICDEMEENVIMRSISSLLNFLSVRSRGRDASVIGVLFLVVFTREFAVSRLRF